MIIEASLSTAYLALKIFLAYLIGQKAAHRFSVSPAAGLITGWLVVQAFQTLIILGLSLTESMYRPYFLACWLLPLAAVSWQLQTVRPCLPQGLRSWQIMLPAVAIGMVMLAMWARSVFFFDYTWDAQTYGLPRLIFWLNHASVLVHMPTPQLNLFVNEWNGELNALAYGLASGSYTGFAFGNLEVLLLLFVAVAWLAVSLGAPLFWALCISAAVGSSPAMLGLASTVKGDLLACAALVMAMAWLAELRHNRGSPQFIVGMLLVCIVMAVAAKISVALPALVLAFFAVTALGYSGVLRIWVMPLFTRLGFVACLFAFSSRFWINLFVYGNPLKRMSHERAIFSFQQLLDNGVTTATMMLDAVQQLREGERVWALISSMAISTWFILAVVVFSVAALARQRSTNPSAPLQSELPPFSQVESITRQGSPSPTIPPGRTWLISIVILLFIAVLGAMSLSKADPWTFRYYAPGLIVILVIVAARSINASSQRHWQQTISIAAVLAVALNLTLVSRPGELVPSRDIHFLSAQLEQADSPLKRATMSHPHNYLQAEVELLGLDSPAPLNILLFQTPDTASLPLYGSYARNRVTHVGTSAELLEAAENRKWEIVAVLQPKQFRDARMVRSLEDKGYLVAVDSPDYFIALGGAKAHSIMSNRDFHWNRWSDTVDVQYTTPEGLPRIVSIGPVDAGFVSQPIVFSGPFFVRARFQGEISGPGKHAGHLSIHGVKPLITLPTGHYSSTTTLQSVLQFPVSQSPQQLSFGLGGWGVGSGHLKLVSLELFELK